MLETVDTSANAAPHASLLERINQMDVQEAIRTVLSVRKYTDQPVPDDVIRQVLEAGRLTASGGNGQRWTFIVV